MGVGKEDWLVQLLVGGAKWVTASKRAGGETVINCYNGRGQIRDCKLEMAGKGAEVLGRWENHSFGNYCR